MAQIAKRTVTVGWFYKDRKQLKVLKKKHRDWLKKQFPKAEIRNRYISFASNKPAKVDVAAHLCFPPEGAEPTIYILEDPRQIDDLVSGVYRGIWIHLNPRRHHRRMVNLAKSIAPDFLGRRRHPRPNRVRSLRMRDILRETDVVHQAASGGEDSGVVTVLESVRKPGPYDLP